MVWWNVNDGGRKEATRLGGGRNNRAIDAAHREDWTVDGDDKETTSLWNNHHEKVEKTKTQSRKEQATTWVQDCGPEDEDKKMNWSVLRRPSIKRTSPTM